MDLLSVLQRLLTPSSDQVEGCEDLEGDSEGELDSGNTEFGR
jgi:hypothetical protein